MQARHSLFFGLSVLPLLHLCPLAATLNDWEVCGRSFEEVGGSQQFSNLMNRCSFHSRRLVQVFTSKANVLDCSVEGLIVFVVHVNKVLAYPRSVLVFSYRCPTPPSSTCRFWLAMCTAWSFRGRPLGLWIGFGDLWSLEVFFSFK